MVWEWVDGGFEPYPTDAVTDPKPAASSRGVLRGGSWDYSPVAARTTYRLASERAWGHLSTGVRCAKTAADP